MSIFRTLVWPITFRCFAIHVPIVHSSICSFIDDLSAVSTFGNPAGSCSPRGPRIPQHPARPPVKCTSRPAKPVWQLFMQPKHKTEAAHVCVCVDEMVCVR